MLQVSVSGSPDPDTGMVLNIADLKRIIKTAVLDLLDHRNIDLEVAEFKAGLVSTTENMAIWCWDRLQQAIPGPARLSQVKIWETEKNIVTYCGEQTQQPV